MSRAYSGRPAASRGTVSALSPVGAAEGVAAPTAHVTASSV